MKFRLFCIALAAAVLLAPGRRGAAQPQEDFPYEIFGRYLEPLAQQIGMPGVSAAILQNGVVVRKYNVGYADVEKKIPAASDTPYAIGGVTQAMTGVLAGVCIDRFFFDINRDMRLYVPTFPIANTSVRQVLSHSTDGHYKYDPALFSLLTPIIESPECFNKSFRQAMAAEIMGRIVMTRTVPGLDFNQPSATAARAQFDEATVQRYQSVLNQIAVPYKIDSRGKASRSQYPTDGLDAANGMVSTIDDLANFELELDSDDGIPLSSFTLNRMWSNQAFDLPNGTSTVRVVMPTGLGWFVTTESGQRLVWTFGHIADASSALIVKMPAKKLTLIMLANSGGLAKGYDLENANVTSSPFVKVFLRLFFG